MGTRSLTCVLDEGSDKEIITMYRQMDGYPEGHGADLYNFLKNVKMVNGISLDEKEVIANGMGCLSAQIVAHFKNGAGGIYMYPSGTRDVWEEYIYTVYLGSVSKDLRMKVFDTGREKYIFDDFVEKYADWLILYIEK